MSPPVSSVVSGILNGAPRRRRARMSEPRAESRAEAFLRGYKTFVRRNRALLTAVEQGAAGLVWFVPDGANAEIYAEAASSLVGVVGTLNEHLVPEDSSDDEFEDAKETPEEEDGEDEASEGDVGTAAAGPEPRRPAEFPDDDSAKNADAGAGAPPSAKTDPGASSSASGGSSRASTSARVSAFLEAVPVPMCLALISQVEVLTEMLAKRRARRRGDPSDEGLGPTVALEAVRAFAKTVLWSHQRGKLLVDDGLSREQLGEEVEGDEVERSSDPSAAPGLAAPPGPGFDRERRAALVEQSLHAALGEFAAGRLGGATHRVARARVRAVRLERLRRDAKRFFVRSLRDEIVLARKRETVRAARVFVLGVSVRLRVEKRGFLFLRLREPKRRRVGPERFFFLGHVAANLGVLDAEPLARARLLAKPVLFHRLRVQPHESQRVRDERLLDVPVELGVRREAGRVVHLDQPTLQLLVQHHVHAEKLETRRRGGVGDRIVDVFVRRNRIVDFFEPVLVPARRRAAPVHPPHGVAVVVPQRRRRRDHRLHAHVDHGGPDAIEIVPVAPHPRFQTPAHGPLAR